MSQAADNGNTYTLLGALQRIVTGPVRRAIALRRRDGKVQRRDHRDCPVMRFGALLMNAVGYASVATQSATRRAGLRPLSFLMIAAPGRVPRRLFWSLGTSVLTSAISAFTARNRRSTRVIAQCATRSRRSASPLCWRACLPQVFVHSRKSHRRSHWGPYGSHLCAPLRTYSRLKHASVWGHHPSGQLPS